MQNTPRSQGGAALIVALLILVILTMLGISALDSTKMETRMVHNMSEYNYAFQAAEMGLSIPRAYDANGSIVENIAKGTPEKANTTMVRDETTGDQFSVEYVTAVVPGEFTDTSGRYGSNSAKIKHFAVESKGKSIAGNDDYAPTVTLRGGLMRPIAASNHATTSSTDL